MYGGTAVGIAWSTGCPWWKTREKWSKSSSARMSQNVVSASVTYLVFHVREWRYGFWMREAVAASYLFSRRFLCLCCQCWSCRGRRSGGSHRVCVRGVSVPWCMGLDSLKNSTGFSSNHALSVTLLKQWVHSFFRSSGVWRYSAADSDANSLFGHSTPLA